MPFKRKINSPKPPKRSSRPVHKGNRKVIQSELPRSGKPRRSSS